MQAQLGGGQLPRAQLVLEPYHFKTLHACGWDNEQAVMSGTCSSGRWAAVTVRQQAQPPRCLSLNL